MSTLLTLIDSISLIKNNAHIVVLATTNRPDAIDTVLRGKFEKEIEMGL